MRYVLFVMSDSDIASAKALRYGAMRYNMNCWMGGVIGRWTGDRHIASVENKGCGAFTYAIAIM